MSSKTRLTSTQIKELGKRVITIEAQSLHQLANDIDDDFVTIVSTILSHNGRLITSGVGKAGLIAQKIAATFASTGTRSFFVHSAEAMHGDLGMISPGDIAILFSRSGETEEVCRLLPHLTHRQVTRIAITESRKSTLARGCNHVLSLGQVKEACPLKLAPSSSTTAMLALGDALALTVLEARGFTESDFARLHPGGSLGLALSSAKDYMRCDEKCPCVSDDTLVRDVIESIGTARAGCACVVNGGQRLLGVFTDGDFRRHYLKDPNIGNQQVKEVMTKPGIHIREATLIKEAKTIMNKYHINALPVLNAEGCVVGLLDVQDIA